MSSTRHSALCVALRVEALKLLHSPVGLIATLAQVGGAIALLAGTTVGIAKGNTQLIAKAGPAAMLDWNGLLAGATQVSAVAAMLGCGVVLAWMFGREFSEGTITGLFALPIPRRTIALSKLIAYGTWAFLVGFALAFAVLALGLLLGYGAPPATTWAALARLWMLTVFSAGIALPVAWIATRTRSVLAAVGSTIALIVTAQVGALTNAGGWVPLAAPALWALSEGAAVTPTQLSLLALGIFLCVALVCRSWSTLQLSR